jgi:hypothetical protein
MSAEVREIIEKSNPFDRFPLISIQEWNQGWHYCPECDYRLVKKGHPEESESCTCIMEPIK